MAQRTVTCAQCGTDFTAHRSDAVVCSQRCGARFRKGSSQTRLCSGCGADISHRMGNAKFCEPCSATRATVHEASRKAKAAVHTACFGCGTSFAVPSHNRFCSSECAGKTNRAKQLSVEITKTCTACGELFITLDNRRNQCGTACKQWAQKYPDLPRLLDQPCATCNRPIPRSVNAGARYCSSECRPTTRGGGRRTAARTARYREAECAYCGATFPTHRTNQRYCSQWCCDRGNSCRTDATTFMQRLGRACRRCGTAIPTTARVNKQFCCESCQVCFNQEIRRARKRGLPSEPISRAEIFARDNYTCHICMKPIEDRPVLDHLIPLALKDSPGHVWENVAAAHAHCNGSKGARVRPEDYDLYVRLSLGGSVCA